MIIKEERFFLNSKKETKSKFQSTPRHFRYIQAYILYPERYFTPKIINLITIFTLSCFQIITGYRYTGFYYPEGISDHMSHESYIISSTIDKHQVFTARQPMSYTAYIWAKSVCQSMPAQFHNWRINGCVNVCAPLLSCSTQAAPILRGGLGSSTYIL